MSATIRKEGGRPVVVLGEGEDLETAAARAAGVGGGVGAYVPLDASGLRELLRRGEMEDASETGRTYSDEEEDAGDADGAATFSAPRGDAEAAPSDSAESLRAEREEEARRRRASVANALNPNGDNPVQAEAREATEGLLARVREIVRPGGKINRRVVWFVLAIVLVLCVYMLGGKKKKPQDQTEPNNPQAVGQAVKGSTDFMGRDGTMRVASGDGTLKSPERVNYADGMRSAAETTARGEGGGDSDPLSGAAGARKPGAGGSPFTDYQGTRLLGPVDVAAPRAAGGQDAAAQPAQVAEPAPQQASARAALTQGVGPDGYSGDGQGYVARRPSGRGDAGRGDETQEAEAVRRGARRGTVNGAAVESQDAGDQPATPEVRLPEGTRIQMELLEPLQTGIETTAEARVLADVKDAKGEVVLRQGMHVSVPFLAVHSNGRMMNNPEEEVAFTTATGKRIVMYGAVKGTDGLVGIAGVVTKTGGGSTIGNVVRGVGSAAARVGERVIGTVGDPYGIEGAARDATGINGAVSGRYGNRNSREVVNIAAGARFTFVVTRGPKGK